MTARLVPGARVFTIAGLVASSISAQELGTTQTASISSGLEFNDNIGLDADEIQSTSWNNVLAYSFRSRTTVDEFDFNLRGNLRVQDRDERETDYSGFDGNDAQTGFRFSRAVDDTEIGVRANYRRNELAFFDPVEDPDADGTFDLSRREGLRESFRTGVNIGLNTNGPVSFFGNADYNLITFSDVQRSPDPDDPDEYDDRERGSVDGELVFRISPLLSLTTGASYSADLYETSENDRSRAQADVGANMRINPRLSSRARIGYSQVDFREDGTEETREGVVGSLTFDIDERLGSTNFGFDVTLNENGQRYTASVGRSRSTDSTRFVGSVGITTSEETDVNVVGNIDYTYSMLRSDIGIGFRQVAGVDEDGDNVINSIGSIRYTRDLTRLSRLSLVASGALRRNLDTGDDDDNRERLNLRAAYSQNITRNWSWNAGYEARFQRDTGEDLFNSNSVFANVSRSFSATR